MIAIRLTRGAYEVVREQDKEASPVLPACLAYSAEVASAMKAWSCGAGMAVFFNTSGIHVF